MNKTTTLTAAIHIRYTKSIETKQLLSLTLNSKEIVIAEDMKEAREEMLLAIERIVNQFADIDYAFARELAKKLNS